MAIRTLGILLAVATLFLAACAPATTPPPATQAPLPVAAAAAPAPAIAVPASAIKPAWQDKWDDALGAAKLEGKVTVFTTGGFVIRSVLMSGVKDIYGISAEVLSGRLNEFLAKALAERRAGLYLYDIYVGGISTTTLAQGKPGGIFQSIDQALTSPDVTDPERIKKVWYKGDIPWVDPGHTSIASTITARTPIVINTSLVKDGEIKSWRDLLNPRWKGSMILNDPTAGSSGELGVAAIEAIMGWDYVKELSKMDLIVLRDQRQQIDWLAHSKAPLVIAPQADVFVEFLRLGAPIKGVVPVEGTWVSSGASSISWISRPAKPNASKVFINWFLSKEGQELFAPAAGYHSARQDVRNDYLRPEDIRQEGVKYLNAYSEDFNAGPRRQEVNKLAKELFGPMVR